MVDFSCFARLVSNQYICYQLCFEYMLIHICKINKK